MINVDFHQGTLRVRGFTPATLPASLQYIPIQWDSRESVHRCDAMWAPHLKKQLGDGAQFDDALQLATETLRIPDRREILLREDQLAAISDFDAGERCGLVVMPTGTGKTVVAIECMIRNQSSTLIVVPVRDLMYQWHTKILEATGINAGLIGDGVHRVSPISVTTYDSAAIHMPRIGHRFDMIVFDEVHHLAGPWRRDAARMSVASVRLGLTATPPQEPSREAVLRELVGPTLHRQSIAGSAGRTLADYVVRRIVVRMEDDERKRYKELSRTVQTFVYEQRELQPDFKWEDVYKLSASVAEQPERAAEAIRATKAWRAKRQMEERAGGKLRVLEDLFRLHAGEPVIVFTGSNVMARDISVRFMVPCLLSHCAKAERRDLLDGFQSGRYPVLVANRVLDEGVDLPEVKIAIVLGGLASQRQAIQRLGRVLRRGSRNQVATLYEIVTDDTGEVQRSRSRRRNDAYRKTASPENGSGSVDGANDAAQ